MSYFNTPAKIAVGGKALFDKWRHERRLALRNSSEPPEPEIEEHNTRSSRDNLEPDSSPSDVGRSGTRPRARASPLKMLEPAPMPNGALPEVTTPSTTKLGRFIKSELATDAVRRASYDGHDSDNADVARAESPQVEQSGAASDSETEPVDAPSSAGDQTAVKNHTTANEPAIWDPPFSAPSRTRGASHRSSRTPTQRPRSNLRRSVRQASPVAVARGEDQNGDGGQGQSAADESGAEDPLTKRYKFSSIEDHRPSSRNPNLFEVLIRWSLPSDVASDMSADDLDTWEPEENIHRDAPRALFAYWKSVGGREAHMKDPGLWHIAAVKKHRVLRGRVQMFVSWVGSGDDSWEPEETVAESAQEVLNEYWEARGGPEKCLEETIAKKTGGDKKRKRAPPVVKKGTAKRTRR